MHKLIITACICGAEPTKKQNPAVPYTLEEAVREAKGAYDAGAAIIHLHIRNEDGTPTQDVERYRAYMDAIRQSCPDAILQPATGGTPDMTVEYRFQPLALHPEIATLDCGTANYTGDTFFLNTESTLIEYSSQMKNLGIKPELEICDKSMIDMVHRLNVKGCVFPPMHFNFVMGTPGGIAATPRDLLFLAESMHPGSTWTVSGVGKSNFSMAAMAIIMGGHVRIGLEYSVYIADGVLAKSNGQMVEKVARLAQELGRPIASPWEARAILGLKKNPH